MEHAEIGLIGLAVMGANLARNLASRKIKTLVYNRTAAKTETFVKTFGSDFLAGETDLAKFISRLERPRQIILMVKAGTPVDELIAELLPLLDAGDILLDCGNSFYADTVRRAKDLESHQIHYLGTGVSGGEEGALYGPSIMPGGNEAAWKLLQPKLEAIAAKDFGGSACVSYIGAGGAGHFVKMVHNGIEYGIMQLLAESYDLLRQLYQLSGPQIADIFAQFNQGELNSYLVEITTKVLRQPDDAGDGLLIDKILDSAAQKGTGSWTAIDALQRGVAIPTITEAVLARLQSADKAQRVKLEPNYPKSLPQTDFPLHDFVPQLAKALYAAILSTYAQGYALIQVASDAEHWHVDLAELSRIWQGGCIIRAKVLTFLHDAYLGSKQTSHLFEITPIHDKLVAYLPDFAAVVATATKAQIPQPAFGSALNYLLSQTTANLPANLLQSLRDYFGAHTYQRNDKPGTFHTKWNN